MPKNRYGSQIWSPIGADCSSFSQCANPTSPEFKRGIFDSRKVDADNSLLGALVPTYITVQSLVDPHLAPVAENADAIAVPVIDLELHWLTL